MKAIKGTRHDARSLVGFWSVLAPPGVIEVTHKGHKGAKAQVHLNQEYGPVQQTLVMCGSPFLSLTAGYFLVT